MGQMAQANKAELERRLRSVRRTLVQGQQFEDIIAAARQNWGVSRGTAIRYFRLVFRQWRKKPATRGDFRRLGEEQRDELYRRALDKDRLREALASLESRDRLRGLLGPRPSGGGGPRTLAEWIRESLKESGAAERAEVSWTGASGGWGSGYEQARE